MSIVQRIVSIGQKPVSIERLIVPVEQEIVSVGRKPVSIERRKEGVMYFNDLLWVANNDNGDHINILPQMANRHGLVAGATGTGKTVTLKVLAESFSDAGVPVFIADVKGDVAGMMLPGEDSENMQKRIERFGLAQANFNYHGYPVTLWDLFGKKGIQLRTTVSEVGPLLMSRILELNDLQTDLLTIIFKIADDSELLLIDLKDLKAMIRFVGEHAADYSEEYGKITGTSLDVITRSIVALEMNGGDVFFGEPDLDVADWFVTDEQGRGVIQILDSSDLISNGKLYSTFLLWLLAELFETLPEVGDIEKPKMVFFFDEAHLLFSDASKALLEKIEQVIKLIRSKGVGIYFCTQNPSDIPSAVLSQLGNKIQHALRAFTPAEQKGIKAAADSFRPNPDFDSKEVLTMLGTGEALVSFLDEKGIPTIVEKAYILPPQCSMGAVTDGDRAKNILDSPLYAKYHEGVDNVSAYENLSEKWEAQAKEEAAAAEQAEKEAAEAAAAKEAAKAEAAAAKEQAKYEKAQAKKVNALNKSTRKAGRAAAGTVGREIGKEVFGKAFGKAAGRVGGNAGAALLRGLFDTLTK